jgi:hypothetical protein
LYTDASVHSRPTAIHPRAAPSRNANPDAIIPYHSARTRIQPAQFNHTVSTTAAACLKRSLMQPHPSPTLPQAPRDTKPSNPTQSRPVHLSATILFQLQSFRSIAHHGANPATTQIRNTSATQMPKISSLLWPPNLQRHTKLSFHALTRASRTEGLFAEAQMHFSTYRTRLVWLYITRRPRRRMLCVATPSLRCRVLPPMQISG